MAADTARHPCFNDAVRDQVGRVHLPVAPGCNIQCNYCNRQFDCVHESRPGVTSAVLSPGQALYYLRKVLAADPRIGVVGIAGPGDPFAEAGKTVETLRRVRHEFADLLLCVATNGLEVAPYAGRLAELRVGHVTVTVNAVDPLIGAAIYRWIRLGRRVLRGVAGARALLERQIDGIRAMKASGLTVKVNTIVIPGVNDGHIEDVARFARDLGADILNCIPMYAVADTPFADLEPLPPAKLHAIRSAAAAYMPQMHHCTRCRADACGLLTDGHDAAAALLRQAAALPVEPDEHRPYVAVASQEGVLVNEHLGHARELGIYERTEQGLRRVETRATPPPGLGAARWEALAELLSDCRAVLCSAAGESPRSVLEELGVRVEVTEGLIEQAVAAVCDGLPLRPPSSRRACGGCRGSGNGCG